MIVRLLAATALCLAGVAATASPASARVCRTLDTGTEICHATLCDLDFCPPPSCMSDGQCIYWDVLAYELP